MLRNIEAGPREVLEPEVQERPPSTLRNIDGGALGVLLVFPAAVTTEVEDVDGDPLVVLAVGPVATITEVEDVDGGPLGGAGCRSDSGHHRS
jgi:hypothetical protein